MAKKRNVAVLVETSTTWGRRLCQGIGNWCKLNPGWTLYLEPHGENELFFLPDGWQGDGIIARINKQEIHENIAKTDVPVVNISGQILPGVDYHRVAPEDGKIASIAVEHLIERGIKNFAYSGYTHYSEKRYEACRQVLSSYGLECMLNPESGTWADKKWQTRLEKTAKWIKTLPKPVGVIAWGTVEGRHIADACEYAGLKVAEDVLIVGWDFDDLIGDMITPSISGVALPTIQQGFEAAAVLEVLMNGGILPEKEMRVEPMGVISRDSTDFIAIDDEEVRDALNFIRGNSDKSIDVSDVVSRVNVSRRTLERRFMTYIERSPADEIRRVHFERAKDLLVKTSLSVAEVALSSGWKYPEQMIPYFREKTGMTPLEFRKKIQAR